MADNRNMSPKPEPESGSTSGAASAPSTPPTSPTGADTGGPASSATTPSGASPSADKKLEAPVSSGASLGTGAASSGTRATAAFGGDRKSDMPSGGVGDTSEVPDAMAQPAPWTSDPKKKPRGGIADQVDPLKGATGRPASDDLPPEPPAEPRSSSGRGGGGGWLPAVIVLLIVLAAAILAWQAGFIGRDAPLDQDPAIVALNDRVDGAEQAARDASQDAAQSVSDLSARMDRIEQAVADLEAQTQTLSQQAQASAAVVAGELEERVSALAQRSASFADRLDERQSTEAALRARIDDLEQRLEQQAVGRAAPILLETAAIRRALSTGEPFAEPLGRLRERTGNDAGLAAAIKGWTDRADTGIPTMRALAERLEAIAVEVRRPENVTGQAWLDRAIGRASDLVHVRQVGDDVEGSGLEAVLARAEARMEAGDLAGAVAQVRQLPAEIRPDALNQWLASGEARLAAESGLSALERSATAVQNGAR